jgi:hypothetical protein
VSSWWVVKMLSGAFSLVNKRSLCAVIGWSKGLHISHVITLSFGCHLVCCEIITCVVKLLRNCKSHQLSSGFVSCCHFIAQKSTTWDTCLSCRGQISGP